MNLTRRFILISALPMLLLLALLLNINSKQVTVASTVADRKTYTNSDMGVSFEQPSNWHSQVLTQNTDSHTVLFNPNQGEISLQSEIEPDEAFNQSILVTRKSVRGSVPQSKDIKVLSPVEYIEREAAGIDGEKETAEKTVGKYQTYVVKRNSAGTTHKMTIYYIFRGAEVFRISLFDSQLDDPRLPIAEEFISSLEFTR